ncbi:hypothetical protein FGIG_11594 [Fasciola gigantica]|uniref:CUB domain-containing protein n=1 Tax=Fasciola gigantica TaxID=46835 RepID=A0A504Y5H9_FASGI|nr:hypothetical protein FGIG_11594 [Fasciola gigantica]
MGVRHRISYINVNPVVMANHWTRLAMIVKFFLLAILAFTGSYFHPVTAQPEICGNLRINLTDDETKFEIGVGNPFNQATTCTYTITGYAGGMITLQIDSLYLGRDAHYNDGYLKVAENQESLNTTDFVAMGTATDTFTVLGNVMVMEVKVARENYFRKCFVKARFLQRPGTEQPTVCGPRFLEAKSEAESLTVPVENATFTGPIVCQYFLRGINYRKLKITFEKLNLPQSENCEKDYVEISELIDDKWRSNKYCGGHLPPDTYTSSKESLHILLSARKYWQKVTVVATYSEGKITWLCCVLLCFFASGVPRQKTL